MIPAIVSIYISHLDEGLRVSEIPLSDYQPAGKEKVKTWPESFENQKYFLLFNIFKRRDDKQ